jgi:hypothetical protein
MEIPPAPTPSFIKPFANDCKPSLEDSIICRSVVYIGTSFVNCCRRLTRSDDGSSATYDVVPMHNPLSGHFNDFRIAMIEHI